MRLLKHILVAAAVSLAWLWALSLSAIPCQGQTPRNMDEDIRMAIPHYNCPVDDYTQYVPAALVLGLKVCGYEGRSGWGPMLTADAFSAVVMVGVSQGLKYSINRTRPDGGHRSFPSGHTATAFMTATMLHKEYGWRSPWWSIGGYTLAAFTGVSRMMNDRHWMSDVAAGAAIGIGSVHLGYWLSDLIFKNRYLNPAYEAPTFSYDPGQKHYVAEMYFARRFVLGNSADCFSSGKVQRGGSAGLSADIPVVAAAGVTARIGANSLTYDSGLTGKTYDALAGGYYNLHFAKRFEAQAKVLAGAVWAGNSITKASGSASKGIAAEVSAGVGLSFMLDENFKIKAFADYQTMGVHDSRWLHTALVGWSAAWVW